ncbi:ribosome-associated protein [Geothermobacter ehrlichii]|uniref:Ribosome-associated protein n=1 Tax=Geothermobacter ehrlichii TaxID=213224 RepID=A0A5D3WQ61_9BACT|nr:alternative ribosome rescue aminoacyl-tRNA hydrolase ArfB [Geothermobacter ehrlichii]TYO99610.1 ribosome-associated protein [Geothermobacter ehrlichii]
MERLEIGPGLDIPLHQIRLAAIPAGGPGGQHVNRNATAIQLRFAIADSCLPDSVKKRLFTLAAGQINRKGVLIIQARGHRSQEMNRREALDRLRNLVARAAVGPRRRIPTRPAAAAVRKRVEAKKRRGRTKALRGPVRRDE